MSKIAVIGGGAAGMLAAATAAGNGHQVTIYERNGKLGKKLFITGKGRCNLTNDSDVDNLLSHVVSNPKFLYSAFYGFTSQDMMEYMEALGLRLKTERGGRVFPASDKSSDVIRTLEAELKRQGVKICYQARVIDIEEKEGHVKGIAWVSLPEKDTRTVEALKKDATVTNGLKKENVDAVILATGGCSYLSTGSSGDGYLLAQQLGHAIIKPSPSLVPLEIEEDWVKQLQGLSLRNVRVTMLAGGKKLYEEQGEMLFTHFGVSGPLILSASTQYSKAKGKQVVLHIDCKPALTLEQLDERVLRDFAACKNSYYKNALGGLLPAKMIPIVIELSQIPPQKRVNEITKKERAGLVGIMKKLEMTVTGTRDFKEAIITKGGVSVKEVDKTTMQSKLVQGLYFAGEILDLDAMTGGYNLQIAWSTAYAAGGVQV